MPSMPTFATPSTMFGLDYATNPDIAIAGIPLDIGTTNRSGSRFGPHGIRHASRMLIDGLHPHSWKDIFNNPDMFVADIGDFDIALGDIKKSLIQIEGQASLYKHLITLGGEHGITLALLRALKAKFKKPLSLLHFDAHIDTSPDNFGQTFAHGSVFYHAINEGLIDPMRMISIGVRAPIQKETWDWTIEKGATLISAQEVYEHTPGQIASRIFPIILQEPTYFSFDIDVLDPAFAPGTGTPECGGLAFWQVQAIIRKLTQMNFVGMDVVEVCPPYDHSEITSLAAATIVWEYLNIIK